MIELKQVCKTFYLQQKQFQALKEIDLAIHRGEIFGIFGASGAGKSTLLRTLNLLEKPTSGRVYIDKVDLTQLDTAQLNQQRKKNRYDIPALQSAEIAHCL
ncbi:Methionine import ATP-binding protein MetN [Aquicella siphonis]|uniref:Methionine import ATP-binding protein MetN n=1 Tax=Aquicella siphonis TaxID=254247 RepID=A0A5E4PF45_9COXI|nr:ATP-binding cassette domain-containing protein [Aquicella siphonis]VVC75610.1 Methionine import ATP-binding protein MetN [Aquicella siphonis]